MGNAFLRRGVAVIVLLTTGVVAGRVGLNPVAVGAHAAPSAAHTTKAAQSATLLDQGQTYSLTALEQQIVNTSRAVAREVVQVENVGVGLGSGVIATSNGYIVTNNHVVSNGTHYFVTLSNGKRYAATLVGTSPTDDLAVLKINQTGLPAARFGNSDRLLVGQEVLAIGNPLGLGETVTSGVVSALGRTVAEGTGAAYLPHAVQTSAPINPGNSGGALVSLDGQVVGIPTLGVGSPNGGAAQGIGFAIPSARIIAIVPQLITSGHVAHTGRAYLGIGTGGSAAQSDPNNPFGPSQPSASGVAITAVGPNTPAARAGLQANDVIVSLAGRPVQNTDALFSILADLHVGQSVQIVVERASGNSTATTRLTRTIVLGELPSNPS